MENETQIITAVQEYLTDGDRYAMMITGEWGCGKTWFVENRLGPELGKSYELVRVSLFGVQSAEEFDMLLVSARLKGLLTPQSNNGKKQRFHKHSQNRNRILGAGLNKLSEIINDNTGIAITLTGSMVASTLTWTSKLLVIDDLERRELSSDKALFGRINDLVEGQGVKVLFLCNEDKDDGVASAFDKLIWRRIHYVPNMEKCVESILNEELAMFPPEIDMEARLISAASNANCHNMRELIRLRRMLRALCKCGFARNQSIPLYSRQYMIEDVIRVCLEYSGQIIGPHSQRQNKHEETENGNRHRTALPTIEERLLKGDSALLEELNFVSSYYDDGLPVDVAKMRTTLEAQSRERYSYSDACKKAIDASNKLDAIPDDDELSAIAKDISLAFKSEDLPIRQIPRMLANIVHIRNIGVITDEEVEQCLEHAKAILRQDPYKSKRALRYDPFSWQLDTSRTDEERLREIDELRDYVQGLSITSAALEREINALTETGQENACERLADKISAYVNMTPDTWACVLVDPQVVLACVRVSDPSAIRTLRVVLQVLFENAQAWEPDVVANLADWGNDTAQLLNGITVGTKARSYEVKGLRATLEEGTHKLRDKM